MKKPMPPPELGPLVRGIMLNGEPGILSRVFDQSVHSAEEPYLHWDELRHRTPPDGLTHEQWWALTKINRAGMRRRLSLRDSKGDHFVYALPGAVLKEVEFVNINASGQIKISEEVTNPETRDRYIVNSLIEEAITSSQLEGAATTRQVAKEMIRTGRRPRDRSEQMILNNYRAMERIGEIRNERLTPEMVCEIHRIVTEGTLHNPDAAGHFQRSDEDRVSVYDAHDQVLHTPPVAGEIPERVATLCDFANGETADGYLPVVLRAIAVHFGIVYDHPFEDGNGRTARALFYWVLLHHDYWLFEFLSISRILKKAPAKFARSFLYSETDEGDLTYFFLYHLGVIRRAVADLHEYLAHKMAEVRELRTSLQAACSLFNYRQTALLQNALTTPGTIYTVESHKAAHRVSTETARKDLLGLESLDLLDRQKSGKKFIFRPSADISRRVDLLRRRPSSIYRP